jgi:hypothetical protein
LDNVKRLLFVFPHPDDETFGPGGTIARYVREGVEVHYACATRGEVGSVEPDMLKPYEHLPEDQRLGALRGQELRCAADKLGLTGLHYLGYRDSGMTGTPENKDPRAFVNADPDRVVEQLVQLIRLIKPQVIVTFDPFGGRPKRSRPPRSPIVIRRPANLISRKNYIGPFSPNASSNSSSRSARCSDAIRPNSGGTKTSTCARSLRTIMRPPPASTSGPTMTSSRMPQSAIGASCPAGRACSGACRVSCSAG